MSEEKKTQEANEEVVSVKMADLKSLQAEILVEAEKRAEERVKEAAKKHFLKETAVTKQDLEDVNEMSETVKFYHAVAKGDRKSAAQITKASYARANKALNTSDDSTLIPVTEETEIIRNMEEYNMLRSNADVRTVSSKDALINEKTGAVTVTVGGEDTAVTPVDPTYTHRNVEVLPYQGVSKWTLRFQNSMEADVVADIRMDFVEGFSSAEENIFLNRATAGEEGIFQVSGTNNYVLGGATNSGSTSIADATVNDVVNAKGALAALGLSRIRNAKLYLTPTALTAIETSATADSQAHLISYTDGTITRVGGLEVVQLNEANMPADDVTTDFAFIADLSKTLRIRDIQGISIEIGEDGNDFSAFRKSIRAYKETGHAVTLPQNIMFLRTSTT